MPNRSSKTTPKKATKKHRTIADENQFAKSIVDFIIEDTEREETPVKVKDPLAVELGRRGGLKGGKARAEKLSQKQRRNIAKKAAKARWSTQKVAS